MATTVSHAFAPDVSPIAIRNFSKERYVSPDWLERERTDLWATSWLVAGVACDVREAGQFITFDIGAESIIIARGAEGQLREQKIQRGHRALSPGTGNSISR